MIVRDTPRPWELLFILRGSILPAIWPQLALVIAISSAVTVLHMWAGVPMHLFSPLPFSLIGIALSIFAGFRNSASFERWWEARKILGQHIVEARSIAREALHYVAGGKGRKLVELMLLFALAFKAHIRGEPQGVELQNRAEGFGIELPQRTSNLPNAILSQMSRETASLLSDQQLSPQMAQVLEERIVSVSLVLAASERIRHTPLPYAYSLLLHRTAYIFCLLLPVGLIDSAGIWTPLIAAVVAYTFFGLDALGDELATPFGTGTNCLPLEAITRTIEITLLEELGHTNLPPPLAPKDYVLR